MSLLLTKLKDVLDFLSKGFLGRILLFTNAKNILDILRVVIASSVRRGLPRFVLENIEIS